MKIEKEEYEKLLGLYKTAQEMPVMTTSIEEGMKHGSWADQAWEDVREYMDELGRKYNYNPEEYAVGKDGELFKR